MIERMGTEKRMSSIVKHNGTVYLCGQVGEDDTQNITEQTRSTLSQVTTLLEQAGSDKQHILSATIYLKNITDYDQMNAVWDAWVPAGHAPARACVQAEMADEGLLFEVSVIAAVK